MSSITKKTVQMKLNKQQPLTKAIINNVIEIKEKLKTGYSELTSCLEDSKFLEHLTHLYNQTDERIRKRKYFIETLIYINLMLYYDIIPLQKEFCNIIKAVRQIFIILKNDLIERYIQIDTSYYKSEVIYYCKKFLGYISNNYKLRINDTVQNDLIVRCREFYNIITSDKLYINKDKKLPKELKEYITQNNFNINNLFKLGYYKNFLPQHLGFIFIYLAIQQKITLNKINNENLKIQIIPLCKELNLSRDMTVKNMALFRSTIVKKYKITIRYYKIELQENYKDQLLKLVETKNNIDAKIMLKLYKMLKLSPREFNKYIIPYKHSKNQNYLLYYLGKLERHITQYKYLQIKKNIQLNQKISNEDKKKAIDLINEHLIRGTLVFHNGIGYYFKYNLNRLEILEDRTMKETLGRHIKKIITKKYPIELFDKTKIRSASQYKLKGTVKAKLRLTSIQIQLINVLKKEKKIKEDTSLFISELKTIVKDRYSLYEQNYNAIPHHKPILKDSIKRIDNVISIELPIWYKEKITGHIDLLAVSKNEIIVCEYKPTIDEVYRGLLQACLYGYLVAKELNIAMNKIKCVIYNRDTAFSFRPSIINDILKFVQRLNSLRKEKLTLDYNHEDLENNLITLLH